jgi:hypothetical protein
MRRRRRKRRASKLILWIGLGVLIAGFVARRTLMPRALDYIRYRPPSSQVPPIIPSAPDATPAPAESQSARDARRPDRVSKQTAADSGENLSDADRRQLDEVLRSKRK